MNTEIRINIKTLLILIGIAIPGITGIYYKLNDSITSTNNEIQDKVKPLEDKVNNLNEKIIVIGINVENTIKAQDNIQKSVDRLINKLIPENRHNMNVHVSSTDPEDVNL